jgi:predicted enzyme related to lactoylglutathione lyase
MALTPTAVKFVLMVQDMDRAVSFYRDILGLSESFSSPHWSELTFGTAILGLHGGGNQSPRETGLSLQYDDVHAAYTAATNAGASGVQAPERRDGEPIILSSISDPEGNIIMLTQFIGHD